MMKKNSMEQGWDACLETMGTAGTFMGAEMAGIYGDSYVSAVEDAIHQMEDAINTHSYRNLDVPRFKGFVFEEWSAGTFNIDAIASGSSDQAIVKHETGYGSVDVHLDSNSFGEDYSMKAMKNAEEAAKAQARLNVETREALYKGHKRAILSDQLQDAKAEAEKQFLRNKEIRPDVAEAYRETKEQLTDRIKNGKGVEGKPIDSETLKAATKDAKHGEEKGEFRAEDYGVTLESSIKWEYVMKQALKAGYSSAIISAAFQLTPELVKCVDYLRKNGELTVDELKQLGEKTVEVPTIGFINGYLSCALQILIEKGEFGDGLRGVGPEWIGATVAIVISTIKDSILVAMGRKTAREMGASFVDHVAVGSGMVLGQIVGPAIGAKFVETTVGMAIIHSSAFIQVNGIITQIIGFEFPIIGYIIGSLIGASISIAYNIGKKKFLSFCVDTGFTCFGLVEQNYEMPVEYLRSIGVEVVLPDFVEADFTEADYVEADFVEADYVEAETVKFYELKRGIIGVNKIGYVLA